jgi:membrane protein DedA with SNARE-associated domain/rhodanese-related sulfurtransferase
LDLFFSAERNPLCFSSLGHLIEMDGWRGTIIAIVEPHEHPHSLNFTRADMNETMHFLAQHGTIVLFATVLAEQIGLPLPAVPFLIAAGALVGTGQMSLSVAVVAAVSAALLGDQVWFELGRRRGRRVLNWLCRISLEPTSCVRRTEDFYARHGVRSLVVAKFVPGLSTIAPPLAGIVGLSVSQYLLYNGLGTFLWVGSGIGVGYVFSDQLEQALSLIAHLGLTVGLILLGGVTSYVSYKVLQWYRLEHVVSRLTVQQVREKIVAGEDPLIIDLRSVGDRRDIPGIPGSLPLSFEELIARLPDLPRDRDMILYCGCPKDAASIQAAWKLREKGFTRVWPLAGGIEAWRAVTAKTGNLVSVSESHPVAA